MKGILKTVLGLAAASVAATAVLAFSVFAAAESANSTNGDLAFQELHGMWQGRYSVSDVLKYSNEFNEPKSFAFYVHGASLTLTGKYPHKYDYKSLLVTLKSEKGIISEPAPYKDRNKEVVTATANYYRTVYYGQYFGLMYDGEDIDSPVLERAIVYVARHGYMPSSASESTE